MVRMKNIRYPNLAAEMARTGLSPADIASVINSTPKTTRDKLNDKYPWIISEMKKIRDDCFPGLTLDYLFYCEEDPMAPEKKAV
ncbi:hypothetical protein LPY66_18430 [Dehalobacter sp. DCM]|uniref:hypothetical protein n=1 Tax=Dehalobacter sp. DCM TaxID=2907827 RepID=UPI003081CCC6|nr:hypothetical protein LPY66_18430 [Dehalobacter sp. DCM]